MSDRFALNLRLTVGKVRLLCHFEGDQGNRNELDSTKKSDSLPPKGSVIS